VHEYPKRERPRCRCGALRAAQSERGKLRSNLIAERLDEREDEFNSPDFRECRLRGEITMRQTGVCCVAASSLKIALRRKVRKQQSAISSSAWRLNKFWLAVFGFAPIANFGTAAQAQVPAASENVSCSYNSTLVSGTTGCSVAGAQSSISTDPVVSLMVSGSAAQSSGSSSMATGSLTYYFEVLGGTQSQQIPILVTTDLNTTISGNGGAGAGITITPQPLDPGFDVVNETVCSNANGCPSSESASFNGTLDATALAGVAGTVTLSISAGGSANAVEGGAGTASADPLIEIDPTYLLTHPGLTLEFSDDVGNGV